MRELCAGLGSNSWCWSPHCGVRCATSPSGPRTATLLARRRVKVLLIQNPSLVLGALAVVLSRVLGSQLFVDAHNEAVTPYLNRQGWIVRLSRWVIRHSDLTIVTNRQLAVIVEAAGGKAFILPDRVPAPPVSAPASRWAVFSMPCSSPPTRPMSRSRKSSRRCGAWTFSCMSRVIRRSWTRRGCERAGERALHRLPPGGGILGAAALGGRDHGSDADGDCLVCGAYEALALGKPMLLSDNLASRELFGDAALYTDNTAAAIRAALRPCARVALQGRVRAQADASSASSGAPVRRTWQL